MMSHLKDEQVCGKTGLEIFPEWPERESEMKLLWFLH